MVGLLGSPKAVFYFGNYTLEQNTVRIEIIQKPQPLPWQNRQPYFLRVGVFG
jgi:hypothetical protein